MATKWGRTINAAFSTDEKNPWQEKLNKDEATMLLVTDLARKFEAIQLEEEEMPPVTYEDSDQSLVYGEEAAKLRSRSIFEVQFQIEILSRSDAYNDRPKLSHSARNRVDLASTSRAAALCGNRQRNGPLWTMLAKLPPLKN